MRRSPKAHRRYLDWARFFDPNHVASVVAGVVDRQEIRIEMPSLRPHFNPQMQAFRSTWIGKMYFVQKSRV